MYIKVSGYTRGIPGDNKVNSLDLPVGQVALAAPSRRIVQV
jgi:hypothetical protein